MESVPSAFTVALNFSNVPSACGTSAPANAAVSVVQPSDSVTGPLAVQLVITRLTFTVPAGVTDHVCTPVPPFTVVAVILKPFAILDSGPVGVHVSVFPLNVAPAGPLPSEKLTVLPVGSVAVTW